MGSLCYWLISSDYFDSNSDGDRFWITDDDNGPVGVAYCELERMTDQTWNLQLIAIHPTRQGQGRGVALLRYVEQTLTARGGRVLLVETSGLPDFEGTRTFYAKYGYEVALWDEYEAAASPEAQIAKALDKLETLLQHNQGSNPPDFSKG